MNFKGIYVFGFLENTNIILCLKTLGVQENRLSHQGISHHLLGGETNFHHLSNCNIEQKFYLLNKQKIFIISFLKSSQNFSFLISNEISTEIKENSIEHTLASKTKPIKIFSWKTNGWSVYDLFCSFIPLLKIPQMVLYDLQEESELVTLDYNVLYFLLPKHI